MTRFALALTILSTLAPIAVADTPPAAPPAAPTAPAPTVDVEIAITDGAATTPSFTGTLAIAGNDCGSLEATAASGRYRVRVCFESRGGAPLLALDLDREITRGKDDVHQKVQTVARVESGKRVVLGRFGQGSDTTEIAATVK